MAIGYIPVGQGGQAQQSAVQGQQASQQSSGVAAAIRAADISLQAKKKEARRIYERAQNQMREDINMVAGFDASVAGTDAAPAIRQAAEDLRQKIREANDPVEAQNLIADFRQKYNLLKAREEQRVEDSKQLNTMSVATGSQMAEFNSSLPPGMEYEEVDASTVARADQAFKKNFIYQDGKIMVQGPDGELVSLDEADFISDTSVYQPAQRKADVGDLQTSAQDESIQARIMARGGGIFKEKNAEMEYDTLVENSNRSGTVLRMQISEDYLDESRKSTYFNDQQEAKAFEIGPNGFSRVEGNPDMEQAWRDVWGEPGAAREKDDSGNIIAAGSGWDLLNQERKKFVDYARTAMDSAEILRRQNIKKNQEAGVAPSRYNPGGFYVETPERQQQALESGLGPSEAASGYSMVAIVNPETGDSDPIKFSGSDIGSRGEFSIEAFGVDPLGQNGVQPMASISVSTQEIMYEGPNGRISEEQWLALDPIERPQYTEKTVTATEQRRIPIGPEIGGEGEAIYNRIVRDPSALVTLYEETQKAMAIKANNAVFVKRNKEAKSELQRLQQVQESEAARLGMNDAVLERQKEFDQQKLDRANARRSEQRSKEIIYESFTDDNVVARVSGVPVYSPPSGSSYIKNAKWYTSAGGDNPIGRVFIYTDSEGKTQKGMAPLRG